MGDNGSAEPQEMWVAIRARSYPSAIGHSVFRDQPRRRWPLPNENCRLRIQWAKLMPAIVIAAQLLIEYVGPDL